MQVMKLASYAAPSAASAGAVSGPWLSATEIAAVRQPLNSASTLPPRCYVDPEFYLRERREVFSRSWLYLCRSEQLLQPGAYVSRDVAGEPVLAMRGRDGVLRARSNVCRHRARRIVEDSGVRADGSFSCPYHGWTYDQAGCLKGAPGMAQAEGFSPADIHLPAFAIEEWLGFVFVNFDPEATPLAPQVAPLAELLAPYRLQDMALRRLIDVEATWNWKSTMDNFSEALHQIAIHRTTAEPRVPAHRALYNDTRGIYSYFWLRSGDDQPFAPLLPHPEGFSDAQLSQGLVVNIYPYFHLLVYPGYTLLLDFALRSVLDHAFSFDVMLRPEVLDVPDLDARMAQLHERMFTIVGEDQYACQGTPGGQGSLFAQQGRLSHQEAAVHQFHNWLLDMLEAGGARA